MKRIRPVLLLLMALLGACTMRSAIDALTSEQDQLLAREMVEHLRRGDEAWLRQHFRPDLWEQSGKRLAEAPRLYPSETGTTELVSVNVIANSSGGAIKRSKEFTLVTQGGGRWTVTSFRTYSEGGPDLVVDWSVTPHSSMPPEFAAMQAWDAAVPWIWGLLIAILLAAVALIIWLVRRSRRRDPLAGQGRAAP